MAEQPLRGRRVLVGRARGQADELVARLHALGADVVHEPLLQIEPGDGVALARAAARLAAGEYTLVALTSPNGVEALATACRSAGHDPAVLRTAPLVAAVGPGTAAAVFATFGFAPDLVPKVATTQALADAIPAGHGPALLPRADLANPVLTTTVAAKGYDPDEVTAYRTVAPDALTPSTVRALRSGEIDIVVFASSSTARHFAQLAPPDWRAAVVSIGPVTTATCRQHGIEVRVEASPHDFDGLVGAVARAATT